MEESMQHFQYIMHYDFKKGNNTIEPQAEICALYGEGAETDWKCQKWFAQFRAGDLSLEDAPLSGRQMEVDSDQINTLIENNQC